MRTSRTESRKAGSSRVWPRASVRIMSGSAGSIPTNAVYQLPVQRKLATAPGDTLGSEGRLPVVVFRHGPVLGRAERRRALAGGPPRSSRRRRRRTPVRGCGPPRSAERPPCRLRVGDDDVGESLGADVAGPTAPDPVRRRDFGGIHRGAGRTRRRRSAGSVGPRPSTSTTTPASVSSLPSRSLTTVHGSVPPVARRTLISLAWIAGTASSGVQSGDPVSQAMVSGPRVRRTRARSPENAWRELDAVRDAPAVIGDRRCCRGRARRRRRPSRRRGRTRGRAGRPARRRDAR